MELKNKTRSLQNHNPGAESRRGGVIVIGGGVGSSPAVPPTSFYTPAVRSVLSRVEQKKFWAKLEPSWCTFT